MNRAAAYRPLIRNYLMTSLGLSSLEDDLDIFQSGLSNSLFAIQLMTFLEKNFQIRMEAADLSLDNFSSVEAIGRFVERKKQADRR